MKELPKIDYEKALELLIIIHSEKSGKGIDEINKAIMVKPDYSVYVDMLICMANHQIFPLLKREGNNDYYVILNQSSRVFGTWE